MITPNSCQASEGESQPRLFEDLPKAAMSKLAPITDETRQEIETFLSHFQAMAEEQALKIKAQPMLIRLKLAEQALYWDHYVGICQSLRHTNRTRRRKLPKKQFKVD